MGLHNILGGHKRKRFKTGSRTQKGRLVQSKDLVVWYHLINNTISSQRSNNYRTCSFPELIPFLKTNRPIQCYCLRPHDNFQELLKCKIMVLSVAKHLISRSKRKMQPTNYCELYQEAGLEICSVNTI